MWRAACAVILSVVSGIGQTRVPIPPPPLTSGFSLDKLSGLFEWTLDSSSVKWTILWTWEDEWPDMPWILAQEKCLINVSCVISVFY